MADESRELLELIVETRRAPLLGVATRDAVVAGCRLTGDVHRAILTRDSFDWRVPDLKPPRIERGERETLLALLQYQRESLVRKVTGVGDDDARRSPVGSGTSLLWLMKHIAGAEITWIVVRYAGETVPPRDDTVQAGDPHAAAVENYVATWAQVDAIVAAAPDLEGSCRNVGDESPVNLRWVLMHLLEETARHAGHADILRELVDGHTGR